MARRGWVPVGMLLGLNLAVWTLVGGKPRVWLGLPLLVLWLLALNFYRDPERSAPSRAGVFAVSPADGRVVAVDHTAEGLHISIFLSAFDVHVNRAPVAGRVRELRQTPGRFLPAFLGRSSTDNERVTITFDSPEAGPVVCTQVAGLLARRIVNWVESGQQLVQGERYGMIALGSRLDVTFVPGFVPLVERGRHVKAGETPLAERARG